MDHLWKLRKVSIKAICQCEQAEQRFERTKKTANQQRQKAVSDAKKVHAQARQQVEDVLQEVQNMAQSGDRILSRLNLSPGPASPLNLPKHPTNADELVRLLKTQHSQAYQALSQLNDTAQELKEERRKWWKFW